MFTINLLNKFISNSLVETDSASKTAFLLETKDKVVKLLKGMETCFYGDKSVTNQKDRNIYTLIKREYVAAAHNSDYKTQANSREELNYTLLRVELELASLHGKCA